MVIICHYFWQVDVPLLSLKNDGTCPFGSCTQCSIRSSASSNCHSQPSQTHSKIQSGSRFRAAAAATNSLSAAACLDAFSLNL